MTDDVPVPRVLLTGARGFVGRHCLPLLAAGGAEVHAVTSSTAAAEAPGAVWHRVDLLDARATAELVAAVRPTHLLHLAWETAHGSFWTSSTNLDWLEAGLELIRAFADEGGRRAVFAGTCAEYRWNGEVSDERVTPVEPRTLYSATKHALHVAARAYAEQSGVSFAWGRVFFAYGPGEQPARLVPSVILALLHDRPADCSHGRQIRDFLHVEDVADAVSRLLLSDVEGAVNIGSGIPTSVADIARTIAQIVGRPELVRLGAIDVPAGDPAFVVAGTKRLDEELLWRPRIGLEAGLRRTIDWWRTAA